jgi:glycosyltransferase involved in cell wall biosynthesis
VNQPPIRTDIIALVWAPEEARTELFARRLGAKVHHIHFLKYKRPLYAPFKYPLQWLKTWQMLAQERPKFIYVTNPPVFATLAVYLFCRVLGGQYIMDTHPPSLYSRKWGWTLPLQRWLGKQALVNITDQERFRRLFESWGARCLVLERPPKDAPFDNLTRQVDPAYFDVAVVNTFSEDEPLQPILDAARQLPGVRFFITGDLAKAPRDMVNSAPENCQFTGYLRGNDYWGLLYASRAVMVLTTFPHSLLGGGQDAMVLHKPAILSRQPALLEYFSSGAVFVENTTAGLVAGVKEAQAKEQHLIQQTYQLLEERQRNWDANFTQLQKLVGQ